MKTFDIPISKRAAEFHEVGKHVEIRGFGKVKFEIVGRDTVDEQVYYKVKPISMVYAVPEDMLVETRHSTLAPLEAALPLSTRA